MLHIIVEAVISPASKEIVICMLGENAEEEIFLVSLLNSITEN